MSAYTPESEHVRTLKQRGYGTTPDEVLSDKNLTWFEKALYGRLRGFATGNNHCYPSVPHIARIMGATDRGVRKALANLKRHKWIKRGYCYLPEIGRSVYLITFLFHENFIIKSPHAMSSGW